MRICLQEVIWSKQREIEEGEKGKRRREEANERAAAYSIYVQLRSKKYQSFLKIASLQNFTLSLLQLAGDQDLA